MKNKYLMIGLFISLYLSTFLLVASACDKEKSDVEEAVKKVNKLEGEYSNAVADSRIYVIAAILSELAPTRTSTPSRTSGQAAKNTASANKAETARITIKRKLDAAKTDLANKRKKLNECLYDTCINCNKNVPKGKPYYHRTFCGFYMWRLHDEHYPTGRYWTCDSSAVQLHKARTCSRSKYVGNERCGLTYRNCVAQECRFRGSTGVTVYCYEYAY